ICTCISTARPTRLRSNAGSPASWRATPAPSATSCAPMRSPPARCEAWSQTTRTAQKKKGSTANSRCSQLVIPAKAGIHPSDGQAVEPRIQRAVNGREWRALDQPNPIWSWTLTYPLLRDKWDSRSGGLGTGYDELRTLAGFFLQQQGAFQPFLFDDPTDHAATAQFLGTGDSNATVYQLVRNMGGFAEPITAPNLVSAIYFDAILQSAGSYA